MLFPGVLWDPCTGLPDRRRCRSAIFGSGERVVWPGPWIKGTRYHL